MELYSTDLAGDELKKINEDSKITVDELKKLNELRLGELSANSAKERTLGVPVKPADGASHEEQANYEMAKNAYDNKVAILDKFDTGITKLKESYATSKEALLKDSKDELAKLEAAIGIAKPVPAEAGTTTPGAIPAKAEGKTDAAPAAKPEPTKAETVIPATPTEKTDAPKTTEYVVKGGDNLAKIAKAHGTTVDALVKANDLADKNKIRVDQKLKVPAKAEAAEATDYEAAKAAAKAPETGKAAKAGEGKAADAKTEKKPDAGEKKVADADKKAEAKAGEVPSAVAPAQASKPAGVQ